MELTLSRRISFGIYLAYIIFGVWPWDLEITILVILCPLVPLLFIWFGDELGSLTGIGSRSRIDQTTPGILIRGAGWILLLGIGVFIFKRH